MRIRRLIWSIVFAGTSSGAMLGASGAPAMTWSAPSTLASDVGISDTAIETAANQTVAAWAGNTGVYAAVAQRVGGFATPRRLGPIPIANDQAQILAMDRRGDAIVMWQQEYSGDPSPGSLYVAYRRAGGRFGRAQLIAPNTGVSAVGLDAHGDATIAWDQYRSPAGGAEVIDVVVRQANGRYGPVRHVVAGPVGLDALSVNSSGQAVIVWHSGRPPATALLASTRPTSGAFGSMVQLASRRQGMTALQAGIDDAGQALIAWEGPYNGATVGTPHSGVQIASLGVGARTAGRPRRLRTPHLGPLGDPGLVLKVDHSGDAILVWQNLTRDSNTVKIVAARRRAGRAFYVPQVLGTSYSGGNFNAAIGPAGASIVSWDRLTTPVAAAVAPGIRWPFGPVTPVAPRQDYSAQPAVTIDSRGHATETWQDLGSTDLSNQSGNTPFLYATAG